jgi:hypothetical protein
LFDIHLYLPIDEFPVFLVKEEDKKVDIILTEASFMQLMRPRHAAPMPHHITVIVGGNSSLELLFTICYIIELSGEHGKLSRLKSLTLLLPSEYSIYEHKLR